MKKRFFCAAVAILTLAAACDKSLPDAPEAVRELSVLASSDDVTTKGYTETDGFYETAIADLHSDSKTPSPRAMLISSYLHPQNGSAEPYFTGNTFSYSGEGNVWWNTVGGEHEPVYWPVGGTLDLLAVSTSETDTKAVTFGWDLSNPARELTLGVPAENSQNDILFASAYEVKSSGGSEALNMKFSHAQAWLEFQLTGGVAGGAVQLKRIEIADAYNAGVLTVKNNRGNAVASWDFSAETRQNVTVDNVYSVSDLTDEPQFLDMLIPQQPKTSLIVYYSLGDDPSVLSKAIRLEDATWLMGERYVYRINVSPSAVDVTASTASWE